MKELLILLLICCLTCGTSTRYHYGIPIKKFHRSTAIIYKNDVHALHSGNAALMSMHNENNDNGHNARNSGFKSSYNNGNAGIRKSKDSSDPWNILVHKLESTKAPRNSMFKSTQSQHQNNFTKDELQCPHFGVCSGCSIKGDFTDIPTVHKAKQFFQSENIQLPIHISDHWKWRTHVKLAARQLSRWGGIKFGLFK